MTGAGKYFQSVWIRKERILFSLLLLLTSCADTTPPIIKAVNSGSLEEVKKAIQYGADLNATDEKGYSGLLIAIRGRWTRLDSGHTFLEKPDVNIAKALIEAGADISIPNRMGYTALRYAIWEKQTDLINLLLEKGASISILEDYFFYDICYRCNLEIIDLVLDKIEKEKRTTIYQTAMQAASRREKDSIELMTKLLDRGANVKGSFYFAALNGNIEAMEFLLQHGADLDETNSINKSGLYYAIENGHLDAVRFLLEKGASITAGKGILEALKTAVEKGHAEIVDLLLENGVNKHGLLTIAAENGQIEVMKVLLMRGANPNETNQEGHTPLTSAVIHGGLKPLQFLIEKGADVNHPDKKGVTPIQYAQDYKDEEMIVILKKAGAKE